MLSVVIVNVNVNVNVKTITASKITSHCAGTEQVKKQ